MGYSVYEDRDNDRWAGYGVPAECDMPGCDQKINRGLAYKCEAHGSYEFNGDLDDPSTDEVWVEHEGCGLFFCGQHEGLFDEHDEIPAGKSDSLEWIRHMLTDDSWHEWRAKNPERTQLLKQRLSAEDNL